MSIKVNTREEFDFILNNIKISLMNNKMNMVDEGVNIYLITDLYHLIGNNLTFISPKEKDVYLTSLEKNKGKIGEEKYNYYKNLLTGKEEESEEEESEEEESEEEKGTYFPNGEIYIGEWKNGKRNGKCKIIFPNGNVFEGEFENDEPKYGRLIFFSGEVFVGDFKNKKINGKGKMTYPKGEVYEGDWKDDKRNGKGKMTYSKGEVYEGDWEDDKRNGKGKMTYPTGEEYEGDWKDDKRNGKGKMTYPTGEEYEGDWKDDKRNGKGKIICPKGKVFEGDWKDDKLCKKSPVVKSYKSKTFLKSEILNVKNEDEAYKLCCENKDNLAFMISWIPWPFFTLSLIQKLIEDNILDPNKEYNPGFDFCNVKESTFKKVIFKYIKEKPKSTYKKQLEDIRKYLNLDNEVELKGELKAIQVNENIFYGSHSTISSFKDKVKDIRSNNFKNENRKSLEPFHIIYSKYKNHIHTKSGLVIDLKETFQAIGREGKDGKIVPLTEKDVEECKKYNIKYPDIYSIFKKQFISTPNDDWQKVYSLIQDYPLSYSFFVKNKM